MAWLFHVCAIIPDRRVAERPGQRKFFGFAKTRTAIHGLAFHNSRSVWGAFLGLRCVGSGPIRCIGPRGDRKSTRLNSSHPSTSYAVFCLKKKKFQIPVTGSK